MLFSNCLNLHCATTHLQLMHHCSRTNKWHPTAGTVFPPPPLPLRNKAHEVSHSYGQNKVQKDRPQRIS